MSAVCRRAPKDKTIPKVIQRLVLGGIESRRFSTCQDGVVLAIRTPSWQVENRRFEPAQNQLLNHFRYIMMDDWTEGQFLALSERFRHKIAAQLLRKFYEHRKARDWRLYRKVEMWLSLPLLPETEFPLFADRYHLHLEKGGLSLKEHQFLTSPIHQVDTPSETPYLPIAIYLDNLRSAFNVGSILRTTEAFRLGTLYFSSHTPFIDNLKVQKTSMWTYDKVPCQRFTSESSLPRPLIALETDPEAPSILDFSFPDTFTLILGNEEYGISSEWLSKATHIVKIPLHGFKNSLNVASAYALAAGVISHQLRYTESRK